jgi:hypothetical protein
MYVCIHISMNMHVCMHINENMNHAWKPTDEYGCMYAYTCEYVSYV